MQHAFIEERILRFLSSAESATSETLRRHAGVPPHNRKTFLALLARLCAAGRIEYKNGVYSLPRPVLYTGVLTGNEKGFAFFTPDPADKNNADKNNAAETPELTAARFAAEVRANIQTESNMRGSAEYRNHLAGVLVKRAVLKLEGNR